MPDQTRLLALNWLGCRLSAAVAEQQVVQHTAITSSTYTVGLILDVARIIDLEDDYYFIM